MSVCGGTLLNTKKVLTAAQCWFDGYHQGRKIQVVLGTTQLFTGWRREITAISVHPQFDALTPVNDLAMLTLYYAVSFSDYLKPALLPSFSQLNNTFDGEAAQVSGFGKTSDYLPISPTQTKQAVSVAVIPYYQCWILGSVNSNNICTSGVNSWGACGGDTGGPLVVPNYYNGTDLLIGVTSLVSPMGCESRFPTGYVRVTSYLSWIQNNL